jgi:glutathione S-transferase
VKVGVMLETKGLAYEPHCIDIMANENQDSAFLALNANGKIPSTCDPDGPSGRPLALLKSEAIRIYLADKTGQSLSTEPNTRSYAMRAGRALRSFSRIPSPILPRNALAPQADRLHRHAQFPRDRC